MAPPARAGEPAPGGVGALLIEVQPEKARYRPDAPIRVRLLISNPTAAPVELACSAPVLVDGAGLPTAIAFGPAESRSLTMGPDADTAEPIAPAADVASEGPMADTWRIGPNGVAGTTIDLRSLTTLARYPGTYRLEWRPLDGRLGTASATIRIEPHKNAVLVTDYGKIEFVMRYDEAPINVANFLELAEGGFYSGKTIHRLVSGFIAQGGCPKGDGTGLRPDGRTVPAELSDYPVRAGSLLMARKPSDPQSASCQFFIALGRLPDLDGQYTVIGQASSPESMRTLEQIGRLPTGRNDKPIAPLVIRSVSLVDPDEIRVRRFDGRTSTQPASTPE